MIPDISLLSLHYQAAAAIFFLSALFLIMAPRISLVAVADWVVKWRFSAAGFTEETHEIDSGETTIHCRLRKDPHRPTLVLLHGFGPSATWQWQSQVAAFSRHFSLVVPDLLFFGGSSTRSSRRSEIFQAECVMKLMDSLGVDRFSVVGTSYGGMVAFHVARLGGERVHRVVIASSDPMKTETDDRDLLARTKMSSIPDLIQPRSTAALRALIDNAVRRNLTFLPEFLIRDILQSLFSDNVKSKIELLDGLECDRNGEISRASLPQPVLLVWGDDDRIFPLKKAHLLKETLGEKVKLEVIEDVGHLPQVETPARFNDIALSFLKD